jgi:hypothetical protein
MEVLSFIGERYLRNLAMRVVKDNPVSPSELRFAPKLIDTVYGDNDGVFEFSDVVDAVTEIGITVVDKAGHLLGVIGGLFN